MPGLLDELQGPPRNPGLLDMQGLGGAAMGQAPGVMTYLTPEYLRQRPMQDLPKMPGKTPEGEVDPLLQTVMLGINLASWMTPAAAARVAATSLLQRGGRSALQGLGESAGARGLQKTYEYGQTPISPHVLMDK